MVAPSINTFWSEFRKVVHPIDLPIPESWRSYYGTLFTLAKELAPRRICEIGVRAGYSAYAMLSANPDAYLLGIQADWDEAHENTHCGRKGLYQHAIRITSGFRSDILIVNSLQIRRLPQFDLVYVDGDHTFDGCLCDLRLAAQSAPQILVDDFCSMESVRLACRTFLQEQRHYRARYIENSLTGQLLIYRTGPN